MKLIGLVAAICLALPVCAASVEDVYLDADVIQTSGEPRLAAFYGYRRDGEGPGTHSFSNALQKARACGVPMLTIWSGPGCQYCNSLAQTLNSPAGRAYVAGRRVLFTYFKGNDVASQQAYRYTYEIGIPEGQRAWPSCRFYWEKPDGTVIDEAWSFGQVTITLDMFKAKLEKLLEGYDNRGVLIEGFTGGLFRVADVVDSRLEVEIRAGGSDDFMVPVPLARRTAVVSEAVEQTLSVRTPLADGAVHVQSISVAWSPDEVRKTVFVSIPRDAKLGDASTLELLWGTESVGTGAIHHVEPQPVSQENPLWIGERTPEDLAWGEWTMDLDAATNKVAASGDGAYTLAVVGGELWCPDCQGFRENLLATDDFTAWARARRVALTLVDVPRSNAEVPTMLSYDEYNGVSGAAYLSRKGVTHDAAREIFDRNHTLCYDTWNVPYENRARLWLPTAVLLRGDGTPTAKLLGDRKYPSSALKLSAYMLRFEEMLALADDPDEWSNNDWTTTRVRASVRGGRIAGFLSATDGNSGDALHQKVIDVAELTDAMNGQVFSIRVAGDQAAAVKTSVWGISEVGETNVLGSVSFQGAMDEAFVVTNRLPSTTRLYLSLEGTDSTFFSYANEKSTIFNYEVEIASLLMLDEARKELQVNADERFAFIVEAGEVYRFEGVDFDWSESDFRMVGENLYEAQVSGTATLTFRESGVLAYQLWRLGQITFATPTISVPESAGTAFLTVVREGGSSGAVSCRISCEGATAVHYTWTEDVVLDWADGENAEVSIPIEILRHSPAWNGDERVSFKLELLSSIGALGEYTRCELTIEEEDPRAAGLLEVYQARPVDFTEPGRVQAKAGEALTFSIRRVGGADGDASLLVVPDGGAEVVDGGTDDLTWFHNSSDVERTLTVKLADDLSAGDRVVLSLLPENIALRAGSNRIYIDILSGSAPAFEVSGHVTVQAWTAAAFESAKYAVVSGDGARRVWRSSGCLPPGVDAYFDGERLWFAGVPSAAGVYHSSWQVWDERRAGGVLTLTIEVDELAAAGGGAGETAGALADGAFVREFAGIVEDGVGLLAVAQGRFNARGVGCLTLNALGGRDVLRSSSWGLESPDCLSLSFAGNFLTANLEIFHDASREDFDISGSVVDGDDAADLTILRPREEMDGSLLARYRGNYVVDLIATNTTPASHIPLALRVSAKGGVSYSGVLPNGRSFRGGASLMFADGDSDVALVPVVGRTASGSLVGTLRLKENAAAKYADTTDVDFNRLVSARGSFRLEGGDFAEGLILEGRGGFFDAKSPTLEEVCGESDGFLDGEDVCYTVDLPWEALASHGIIPLDGTRTRRILVSGSRVKPLRDPADASRLAFSCNRTTGLFTGRFEAWDSVRGEVCRIRYAGVLMPNWGPGCGDGGCGFLRPEATKPFGSAACWLSGSRADLVATLTLTPAVGE